MSCNVLKSFLSKVAKFNFLIHENLKMDMTANLHCLAGTAINTRSVTIAITVHHRF